jgi:predicted DsbA family dithiol-disulfide isomerase
VRAVVWSDYLCPWCYLGRDRTALLERLDVSVTHRPYDLHPELPAVGRRVSATGRLADVLAYVGAECAAVGMPFRAPEHIPNTRRALLAAEVVHARWPEKFGPLDDALFAAVFVEGVDIGDRDALTTLMNDAGVDGEAVHTAIDAGDGLDSLRASMAAAHDAGVSGAPAWLLDDRLLIPGVQDHQSMEIWVERMRTRRARSG